MVMLRTKEILLLLRLHLLLLFFEFLPIDGQISSAKFLAPVFESSFPTIPVGPHIHIRTNGSLPAPVGVKRGVLSQDTTADATS